MTCCMVKYMNIVIMASVIVLFEYISKSCSQSVYIIMYIIIVHVELRVE